jgi:hypothetical protein
VSWKAHYDEKFPPQHARQEESAAVDGAVTRRIDQQDSCAVDTNGLPVRLALTAGEAQPD